MKKKKKSAEPKQKKPIKKKPVKGKPVKGKLVKPDGKGFKGKKSKRIVTVKRLVSLNKKGEKTTRKKTTKVSPELKDYLKEQGLTLKEFNKQSRKIQKEYKEEFRETRPQQGMDGEWYYPNTKALKEDYKNPKVASYRHNSYESALKWWKGVTGGAGYFVILRKKSPKTGKELFFVMDIDPERRRKGTSKKVSDYQTDRALKLEEKFREAEDY